MSFDGDEALARIPTVAPRLAKGPAPRGLEILQRHSIFEQPRARERLKTRSCHDERQGPRPEGRPVSGVRKGHLLRLRFDGWLLREPRMRGRHRVGHRPKPHKTERLVRPGGSTRQSPRPASTSAIRTPASTDPVPE